MSAIDRVSSSRSADIITDSCARPADESGSRSDIAIRANRAISAVERDVTRMSGLPHRFRRRKNRPRLLRLRLLLPLDLADEQRWRRGRDRDAAALGAADAIE